MSTAADEKFRLGMIVVRRCFFVHVLCVFLFLLRCARC